nr:hypothetical protein HAGR004_01380 [Bdellovibrio sp. HAGR004]
MRPTKSNLVNAKAEDLWQTAVDIIRRSPEPMAALEFETAAGLVLTMLDLPSDEQSIAIAYFAAVEGENLEWFLDRLHFQKSKCP